MEVELKVGNPATITTTDAKITIVL